MPTTSLITLVTTADYLLCFLAGLKCRTSKASFALDVYVKYTVANWLQTLATCFAVRAAVRRSHFQLDAGRWYWARGLRKLLLLWLGFDLWFYWVHRLAHKDKRVFKLCHGFHHEAREAEPLGLS